MKPFGFHRDGLFLFGCGAYVLNRRVLKPHLHSGFLHSHFNDLWLIPCALPLLLGLHRWLEFVTAGELLQRCRTHFLDEIKSVRHALVLSPGPGRVLPELARRHLK